MASVSREAAAALLEAAIATATQLGIGLAIAVTDTGGHLKAFTAMDTARFLATEVAIDKARTAASIGVPTHIWPSFLPATLNPAVAALGNRPHLVAVGGGYPLLLDGQLIGGIGVSGSDETQDRLAAEAALKHLGFTIPAGFGLAEE